MNAGDFGAKRAIVIAGPTASGKSALALALAEQLDGMVINGNSMQVYADLRILTARPSTEDEARVPHRLFGHVDAAEAYSVGRWLDHICLVLDEACSLGRVPIIVGGTGLYLKALTQGLSDIPPVPDEVRARVRAAANGLPPQELHDQLRTRDPDLAARLRPSDPQRIIRALEVIEATGQSLSTYQGRRRPPLLGPDEMIGVVMSPERAVLNARIDARFDAMIAAGALDEVGQLDARALDRDLPAMRALGVLPLVACLHGTLDLDSAMAQAKAMTRHYAKRQATFFRHQLPALLSVPALDPNTVVDLVRLWSA